MDDLLTTRQVQNLLKVDRITVYRMLNDGRLKGIKIGQQWRFPQSEVEHLLSGETVPASPEKNLPTHPDSAASSANFPTHCVQVIQDLYTGLGKIGAITLDPQGAPLTEISRQCAFCALVQSTPAGLAACRSSWEALARQDISSGGEWLTCHAGLRYQQAAITENGETVANLLSGQVFLSAAERQKAVENSAPLAARCGLAASALAAAAHETQVLSLARRAEVESWPAQFVRAVEGILSERAGLVTRLKRIAEISTAS